MQCPERLGLGGLLSLVHDALAGCGRAVMPASGATSRASRAGQSSQPYREVM
jgi:hypothetical protein